jgi:hypothetical protein
MKHLAVFLTATLLGLLLAAGVLWINPFAAEPRQAPVLLHGVTAELRSSLQAEDLPLLTHSSDRRLLSRPDTVPQLWESTIEPVLSGLVVLRDADGRAVGTASRLGAYSRDTDLLLAGVVVESSWLLSLDGVGMAFVLQHENVWPMLKAVALPATLRREAWQGDLSFTPAAGPREDRAARVIGISGDLAGLEGQLVASYRLRAFDPEVGPTRLEWRAVLSLPVTVEADEAP